MEGKKIYKLRISDYSGLYLEDPEEGEIWSGDEEDIGIQFLEDTEEWEYNYRDKVNQFFFEKFGITEDQIEEW